MVSFAIAAVGVIAVTASTLAVNTSAPVPPARRLVVSFVVGLEGTGHHWYYAFWNKLAELSPNEVACDDRLGCKHNSSAAAKDVSRLVASITGPEPNALVTEASLVQQLAAALAETARARPSATGLGVRTCSFNCGGRTMDEKYGPGRWPKLVSLARAVLMASAALAPQRELEPAFLVLERSAVEVIVSVAKHRHLKKGHNLHAYDNIAGETRNLRDQRAILETELALLLSVPAPVRIAVANFSAQPLNASGLACLMQLQTASVQDALMASTPSDAHSESSSSSSTSHGSVLSAGETAYVCTTGRRGTYQPP